MLKGRGEGIGRKPRLFIDSGDTRAEEESDDPVAATLAARNRKQGAEIVSNTESFASRSLDL